MRKTSKQEQRNKKIEEILRLTWASLETHLPHTYGSRMIRGETLKFHQDTVKEYVRIIQLVTDLYEDDVPQIEPPQVEQST